MKKWNMIIDVARCHNCNNCFVATKDEYVGNNFPGVAAPQPLHDHSWVDIECKESGQMPMVETQYRPVMCNHCDDAPCMKVAKDGAIKKRDDGIVIIDPEKSKGQKQIVDACPYGAVYWNEDLQIPQAWPFDAHLIDQGWNRTKLDAVCPSDVFQSLKVTDEEMQKIAKEENLETLEPKLGAKPRVYYKNNYLIEKCFIGGTVVTRENGYEDCVEGANIKILKENNEIGSAKSDAFGEFKIHNLDPALGSMILQIDVAEKTTKILDIDLGDECMYVGCIEV